MVSIQPNKCHIGARVLNYTTADFGGWAELEIKCIQEIPGHLNMVSADLVGTALRVFVPPSLTKELSKADEYSGEIAYRGNAQEQVYALLPRRD